MKKNEMFDHKKNETLTSLDSTAHSSLTLTHLRINDWRVCIGQFLFGK